MLMNGMIRSLPVSDDYNRKILYPYIWNQNKEINLRFKLLQ